MPYGSTSSLMRSEGRQAYGVTTGIVVDINEQRGEYCLKVRIPDQENGGQTGDSSTWCRVATLWAHKGDDPEAAGWHCLPEVGDEVLLAFVHGDFDAPVVIGSMYNSKNPPVWDNAKKDGGKNDTSKFKSRVGHELIFNDNRDKKGWVEFRTKKGHRLKMVDEPGKEYLELVDSEGKLILHFDTAKSKITLENKKGDIHIKAAGNLKMEADANIEMSSAADTTIKAAANLTAKGANVKVSASANAEVSAGAVLNLKGSMININ